MADLEQQQNGELEESLRFEPLEDLDDVEFDIPQIDFTPTLNEILDANDDDLDLAEDYEEEEVAGSNLDVSVPDGVRLPVSLLERISLGSGGDAASRSGRGSRGRGSRGRKKGALGDHRREEAHGAIMRSTKKSPKII